MLKALIFWGTAVTVFGAANGLIVHKERLKKNGRTVFLQLAPRDPRSLLQGDYMALRYDFPNFSLSPDEYDGHIVVKLGKDLVGEFARFHGGEHLATDEVLIRYRFRRNFGLKIGGDSFFFQEGHSHYYENACYGELKVASNGECLLIGLRGKNLERLGPP